MNEKEEGGPTAASLASWEKHTKGIGSKLLQKFGFKGRLGANETGIAKAIEVYVRPTNAGLGFGDIDAPKVSEENHILGDIVTNKKVAGKKRKKPTLEDVADEQGWKKTKYDNKKTQSKEIDEYLSKLSASTTSQPVKIIDMRRQDVRIITNMADLADEDWDEEEMGEREEDNPPIGAELLFNLGKVFDNEKSKYSLAVKRVDEERSICRNHKEEIKSLQSSKSSDAKKLRRMTLILGILKELNQLSTSISGTDSFTLDTILAVMETVRSLIEDLYRAGPQEFKLMGFMRVISSILVSLISKVTKLNIYQQSQWLRAIYSNWQLLMKYFVVQDETSLTTDCKVTYEHAVETSYLPFWRQFVSSGWNGTDLIDDIVDIATVLQVTLPPSTFAKMIDEFLIPKLVLIVQNWKELEEEISLHSILIPWLPLLKEKLQPTYPEVRRKLATTLRSWRPKDIYIIKSIQPWIGVFDKSSFDNLLSRVVVPTLVDFIRDEVIINPAQQDLQPFQSVLAWYKVLPLWQLDCLLAGEFFPKFVSILITWLSLEDPDYSEVSQWYTGWKSMFPEELVGSEANLSSKALALVLDIMQTRLMSETNQEFSNKVGPIIVAMQRNNYYALAKEFMEDNRQQARVPLSYREPEGNNNSSMQNVASGSSTSSIKEVLELLAEQNGFIFAPKFGKSVQGKPIWEFGKSQIYISNEIVYILRKSAEKAEWSAISLSDLLTISR